MWRNIIDITVGFCGEYVGRVGGYDVRPVLRGVNLISYMQILLLASHSYTLLCVYFIWCFRTQRKKSLLLISDTVRAISLNRSPHAQTPQSDRVSQVQLDLTPII